MNHIEFYKLSKDEKINVFKEILDTIDLPIHAIEKDWWVVQALRTIFSMEVGEHILFKGGTSLSTAWGLIERFSEDVDLALNKEYLGFDSGLISKTQVRKLRTKSFEYITEVFAKDLQSAFEEQGITDLRYEFENLGDGDQDPVSILIYYPYVTEHSAYLEPRIKVEMGSRSLRDPYSSRKVQSLVGQVFDGRPFADEAIDIACVNPERTYLEKLYLLHEEFQRPADKIRVDRLSRHLYDIERIYKSDHSVKALDKNLISEIIEHRRIFSAMKGVDYDKLYPPHLNSIPPDEYIDAWEADYKKMQQDMIHGKSLPFDQLIEVIREALSQYNNQVKEADGK